MRSLQIETPDWLIRRQEHNVNNQCAKLVINNHTEVSAMGNSNQTPSNRGVPTNVCGVVQTWEQLGVRRVTPSKTQQVWSICKLHYGRLGYLFILIFLLFFPFFFFFFFRLALLLLFFGVLFFWRRNEIPHIPPPPRYAPKTHASIPPRIHP